jgi:hypothetical protein
LKKWRPVYRICFVLTHRGVEAILTEPEPHVLPFSVPPSVGETTGSPEAIVGQRPVHVIRDMMTIANVFNSTAGGLQIPSNVVFY